MIFANYPFETVGHSKRATPSSLPSLNESEEGGKGKEFPLFSVWKKLGFLSLLHSFFVGQSPVADEGREGAACSTVHLSKEGGGYNKVLLREAANAVGKSLHGRPDEGPRRPLHRIGFAAAAAAATAAATTTSIYFVREHGRAEEEAAATFC